MSYIQLSNLINTYSPNAILEEIRFILRMISPEFDTSPVEEAFHHVVELYNGDIPGYRACNTQYHDLRHVTDVFLAMARLLHGAWCCQADLNYRISIIGLLASLLHDTGYIQEEWDNEGTGAKYTTVHVERSADFLEYYGAENGLSHEEIEMGRAMIMCTDMSLDISEIQFPSSQADFLGKMLCAADLLAQMADRNYLEKLLFLYHEFKECGIGGYESATDLLRKTAAFYEFVNQRIRESFHENDRFLIAHFASRWDIHRNLYHEAIENQRIYLKRILENPDENPFSHLRRYGNLMANGGAFPFSRPIQNPVKSDSLEADG